MRVTNRPPPAKDGAVERIGSGGWMIAGRYGFAGGVDATPRSGRGATDVVFGAAVGGG
jgi:hypothetical protein